MKVLNKHCEFKTGTTVIRCEFKAKVPSEVYDLFIEPKATGQKYEPILVTDSLIVEMPTFTALDSERGEESERLVVTGKYFGSKPPKMWVEYHEDGEDGVKTQKSRCKVDNKNHFQ